MQEITNDMNNQNRSKRQLVVVARVADKEHPDCLADDRIQQDSR
jgi:hypothetical protein